MGGGDVAPPSSKKPMCQPAGDTSRIIDSQQSPVRGVFPANFSTWYGSTTDLEYPAGKRAFLEGEPLFSPNSIPTSLKHSQNEILGPHCSNDFVCCVSSRETANYQHSVRSSIASNHCMRSSDSNAILPFSIEVIRNEPVRVLWQGGQGAFAS